MTFALRSDFAPTFLRLAVLVSGIVIALSLLRRSPRDKAGNVVPPGPKGFPLIGERITCAVLRIHLAHLSGCRGISLPFEVP